MSAGHPAERRTPRTVSVVVPVRDAQATIEPQLDALARQTYAGVWELILADNGSRDGTWELLAARLSDFRRGRLVDASMRQGPSHARNEGARTAKGDLLLFCDADDVVSPGWVASMVHAAGDADLVAGRLDLERLNGSLCRAWHDTPPVDRPLRGHDFLPFASGGNCAIWRDVFESLGGFDERRVAGEDVDLSWRAQLASYRLGFAADGVVHQRLKSDLRELASQHFGWGRAYVELFRDFRPAGMPRTSLLGAAAAWGRIIVLGPFLALSQQQRGRWIRQAAERSGQVVGSVAQRVLFL